VNALYARYENAHEGFTEHYLDLLRAGGSKPYNELLVPFGLDARDPDFWQAGLNVISGFIDELEALEA
jgi:oligoendopeptidase F